MKHRPETVPFALLLAVLATPLLGVSVQGCDEEAATPQPEPGEELLGGELTVFDTTRDAFGRAAPTLPSDTISRFFVGNSFFSQNWVTAPASTAARDGLGPTYNARACASCHFKDGRGRPPRDGEPMIQMLIRLSVPGDDGHGGPLGDAVYGGQLNPVGILDVPGEGIADLAWEDVPGEFADGTPYTLRRPNITFAQLAYGPMPDDLMTSPRVAPAVYGLGLLEAVPEADILALADPDDADGDGISGRPNMVWNIREQATTLGRFGWKANMPTLEQQNAGAFVGDIGITSPLFPEQNCPEAQTACGEAIEGGEPGQPEVDADRLADVTFYTQTLAVPARRNWTDPEVLRGRELFRSAGCPSCHVERLTTGPEAAQPQLANQTIRPYTDLLLHDMGDGLADGRPDYLADGREWRTAPLWGIGLIERVNEHTELLHDGRARGMMEAILWHGGEGEASREAVRHMSAGDRDALVAFLESL